MKSTHEIHLEAVAGVAFMLADKPDCKTAVGHIVKVLRREQMKLRHSNVTAYRGYQTERRHPNLQRDAGIAALLVIASIPFLSYAGQVLEYVGRFGQ